MSKHINVNPGQYKVAGRERPGDNIPEPERSKGIEQEDDARERWEEQQKKHRDKDE